MRPACGPSRATGPASPAKADHDSAAATSCASRASAAARAPRPTPPTPRAARPATPTAPTTPAAHRQPARAPPRRSPPPPSAPHPLIRHPQAEPCRLNAYAFCFGRTCTISSMRWVWSRFGAFRRGTPTQELENALECSLHARSIAGARRRSRTEHATRWGAFTSGGRSRLPLPIRDRAQQSTGGSSARAQPTEHRGDRRRLRPTGVAQVL